MPSNNMCLCVEIPYFWRMKRRRKTSTGCWSPFGGVVGAYMCFSVSV